MRTGPCSKIFLTLQDINLEATAESMKLHETAQGVAVNVYVKPRSKHFQLTVQNGELVVFCRETPVRGRVNRELRNELSKLFKRRVEILSGLSSRQKNILINNISLEEAAEILSANKQDRFLV